MSAILLKHYGFHVTVLAYWYEGSAGGAFVLSICFKMANIFDFGIQNGEM